MTGGQTLALILTLLYLSECILWLDTHSRVLSGWLGRWWIFSGKDAFGSSQGGIVVLNPLPPPCEAFRADDLPLWLSPQGVVSLSSGSVRFVPLTETIETHSDNKTVQVNGVPFCSCATTHQARLVAELLTTLARTPLKKRKEAICAFWTSRLDLSAVQEQVKRVRASTHLLRILCNIQLFIIFAIGLLFAIATELHIPIFALLIVLLPLNITLAIIYFRVARRLYPEEREERITHLVKMIVCPPISVRSCDFLTLPATRAFDALTVELALLEPDQAAARFAQRWREVKYPIVDVSDEASEVLEWHQAEYLSLLEKLGQQAGLDPEKWSGEVNAEPGSLSYCPRCLCQFTYSEGTCRDCSGVVVIPFAKNSAPSSEG